MTLDARLGFIVEEATSAVRTTVHDAVTAALSHMPSGILRDVARRAYELGYREALAARGQGSNDAQEETSILGGEGEHDLSTPIVANRSNGVSLGDDDSEFEDDGSPDVPEDTVEYESFPSDAESRRVDWSGFDANEAPEDTELERAETASSGEAPARGRVLQSLRIFPHATVGTLRQRIVDAFDLTRFDIDVILCRKGDSSRRQLKSSVKLSKYLVEG